MSDKTQRLSIQCTLIDNEGMTLPFICKNPDAVPFGTTQRLTMYANTSKTLSGQIVRLFGNQYGHVVVLEEEKHLLNYKIKAGKTVYLRVDIRSEDIENDEGSVDFKFD